MALKMIDLNELKYCQEELANNKLQYDEKIEELLDAIKMTAIYWQGDEGDKFRDKLYTLIGSNLNCISKEMKAEIDYTKKLIMVLENAQEQVKNRINS